MSSETNQKIEAHSRVSLSRHAALKTRGGEKILVLPERAIRLGGSGGEILTLCETESSPEKIVSILQSRYPESSEIEAEVQHFLAEMKSLGGLTISRPQKPTSTKEKAR